MTKGSTLNSICFVLLGVLLTLLMVKASSEGAFPKWGDEAIFTTLGLYLLFEFLWQILKTRESRAKKHEFLTMVFSGGTEEWKKEVSQQVNETLQKVLEKNPEYWTVKNTSGSGSSSTQKKTP